MSFQDNAGGDDDLSGLSDDIIDEVVEDEDDDASDNDEEVEEDADEEDEFEDETEDDIDDDDEEEDDEEVSEEEAADEEAQVVITNLQAEANAIAGVLAKSSIDYNSLVAEFKQSGKLSAESIVKLAKAGYSETLVNSFIQGQQAKYDIYASRVHALAGGTKEYVKLMKWASQNLGAKERERFDKAVDSNDIDEARFAVEGLKARFEREVGVQPKLVRGRSSKTIGIKPFASFEAMAQAMDDERYETDATYTRQVERRILASNF